MGCYVSDPRETFLDSSCNLGQVKYEGEAKYEYNLASVKVCMHFIMRDGVQIVQASSKCKGEKRT